MNSLIELERSKKARSTPDLSSELGSRLTDL